MNFSSALLWFAQHGFPGAAQQSAFRKYCRRHRGTELRVNCHDGQVMDVIIGDSVDNNIAVHRVFEESTTRVISKLAGVCSSFIDVGCNIGYYSSLFAHQNPTKPLVAIDPNPKMSSRTRNNLALNESKHSHVLDCGIGAEQGELELHIPENRHSLASFAYVPDRGGKSRSVKAKVVTLSDVLHQQDLTDVFVKIDTEGFERDVFQGLEQRHLSDLSFILFEMTGSNMTKAGYTPTEFLKLPIFDHYHFYIVDDHSTTPLTQVSDPIFPDDVNINVLLVRKEQSCEQRLEEADIVQRESFTQLRPEQRTAA